MFNRIISFLFGGVRRGMFDNCKLSGEINLLLKDKNGKVKLNRTIKNTITDAGKAALAGLLLLDVSGTAFDYIAIGVGSPSATALGSESTTNGGTRRGGADVVGTRVTTTVANDTAQFVTTFTFTGALAITEEGIFQVSTGSIMLASQSFAAVNVGDGDILQITHKVKVA